MTLIREVFKPLIQYDISLPSQVQYAAVRADELAKPGMTLGFIDAHRFCQLTVEVDADRHIRIYQQPLIGFQVIRQRERDRVATTFQYFDMQVAVTSYARSKTAIEPCDFRDEPQETQVVAFVKRHQADEAAWLYYGLRNQMRIE